MGDTGFSAFIRRGRIVGGAAGDGNLCSDVGGDADIRIIRKDAGRTERMGRAIGLDWDGKREWRKEMEFGKTWKRVFGGKQKEERMTPAEEKKQAADVREAGEKLKNALISLRLTDSTGRIPMDVIEEYKRIIRGLVAKLDQAQVSLADTRSMDKKMLYYAQHLDEIVKNGSRDTADRIIKGLLLYGIGKGHDTIPSSDAERTEQIMEEREKRLDQYKTIVEYSVKIDEREQSMERQNAKYDAIKKKFEKDRESVLEAVKKNPHLVQMIDELGEGVKTVSPEAYELVVKQKDITKMYDSLKALKQQKSLNMASIVACRQIIRDEEMVLTQMAQKLDQHMIDDVIRHEAEFRKQLVDLQKQVDELEELGNRFTDTMDEVFSSPAVRDYIIRSQIEFEEMEKEIQQAEEGKREGLRRMREQELEQENEQENEYEHEQILNQ